MTSDLIATDQLPDELRGTLEFLVAMMIPQSREYAVPGADDALIFAGILDKAAENLPVVIEGLKALDDLSTARHGERFSGVDDDRKRTLVEEFKGAQAQFVRMLTAITAQCYYRDDRVLEALGMEARSPFPDGFTVEQGDWSLLEPVRQRGKLYR
jgi:hypothetical protein